MMKRFLVFIFLFLVAGLTLAQDMPPLPSDAPASAVPSKDSGMPVLPDAGTSIVSTTVPSDMPALPDASAKASSSANNMSALSNADNGNTVPASAAVSAASSDMPPLPDTGSSSTANAMPVMPSAGGGSSSSASTFISAASDDMPPLPGSGGEPSKSAVSSSANSDVGAVPTAAVTPNVSVSKPTHVKQPWKESKVRPNAIFGGWIRAKGGNITSRLSWSSQQTLNALDAKKYKMGNEEGVYEGEQNKGPQYRKFTFNVPKSKDTVIVLLKQVGSKIWLRVGPDEEPAPANHTYAEVAKMSQEDLTVLRILKAKFGGRISPHHMVPSWDAQFSHRRETADE